MDGWMDGLCVLQLCFGKSMRLTIFPKPQSLFLQRFLQYFILCFAYFLFTFLSDQFRLFKNEFFALSVLQCSLPSVPSVFARQRCE